MEARISQDDEIIDMWRVFAQNARINTDERLVQLIREFSLVKWDIVCFSETRCRSQDIFIDDGHRLIYSNSDEARSAASGVRILIHRRRIKAIKQRICVTDRVMAIDLKISHNIIRIIAVYLLHAGYESNCFQSTFDDVE